MDCLFHIQNISAEYLSPKSATALVQVFFISYLVASVVVSLLQVSQALIISTRFAIVSILKCTFSHSAPITQTLGKVVFLFFSKTPDYMETSGDYQGWPLQTRITSQITKKLLLSSWESRSFTGSDRHLASSERPLPSIPKPHSAQREDVYLRERRRNQEQQTGSVIIPIMSLVMRYREDPESKCIVI